MHQVLFDAIAAALGASDSVTETLRSSAGERREQPPPDVVLEQIRQGLSVQTGAPAVAAETTRLVEAVRVLAVRHGPAAVKHCALLIEGLRELLDSVTGTGEPRS